MKSEKFLVIFLIMFIAMSLGLGVVSAEITDDSSSYSDSEDLDTIAVSSDSKELTSNIGEDSLNLNSANGNCESKGIEAEVDSGFAEKIGDDAILGTGTNTIENNEPKPMSNVVTNDTFFDFFDENGNLIDGTFDASKDLIFQGTFSGLGVNYTVIDVPVNVVGDGASFVNMGLKVVNGGAGSNITGIAVTSNTTNSLWLYCTNNVTVEDSSFTVTKGGLFCALVNSTDNIIDGCTITGNSSSALVLGYADNNIVSDCDIKAGGNLIYINPYDVAGIGFATSPDRADYGTGNLFVDNRLYGARSSFCIGFQIYGTDNAIINNTIVNTGSAVSLPPKTTWAPTVDADNNLVAGNVIINCTGGIVINGMGCVVENNSVTNSGIGITISKPSTVKNNVIVSNGTNVGINVNAVDSSVLDNTITTASGVGIKVAKANATVVGNNVTTGAAYAIDLGSTSGSVVSDNYLVAAEETGNDAVSGSGVNTIDQNIPKPFCNVVTNDTFFDFFDEYGNLLDDVDVSQGLFFQGTFANLTGIESINFANDNPINITGVDAVLYDMYVVIMQDDVSIDNVSLISDKVNYGIYAYSCDNVTLSNVLVDLTAADNTEDAYGIYAEYVGDFTLVDSIVKFNSTADSTATHYAISVSYCDDVVIDSNVINADIPIYNVAYDPYTYAATYKSLGLYVANSAGASLTRNNITVSTKSQSGSTPTLLGVYLLGDSEMNVADNNIKVTNDLNGTSYIYGVKVEGFFDWDEYESYACDDFVINGNTIISSSKGYYANGIEIDGPADGVFSNNIVDVEAKDVVYGIYSAAYNGAVNVDYISNNITGSSNSVYGMSIMGTKENVIDSNIILEGNFTTGIATSSSVSNTITGNNISVMGAGLGTPTAGDYYFPSQNVGILAVQNAQVIANNNNITTTGTYTINLTSTGSPYVDSLKNNISDNYLIADKLYGDSSVYYNNGSEKNNIINNNLPAFVPVDVTVDEITVGSNVTGVVDGIVDGTVTAVIDGAVYNGTVVDGKFNIDASDLPVGNYSDVAMSFVSADGNARSNATVNVTVSPKVVPVDVTVDEITVGSNVTGVVDGIVDGTVTAVIDGAVYNGTVVDGKFNIDASDLPVGNYSDVAMDFVSADGNTVGSTTVNIAIKKIASEFTNATKGTVYNGNYYKVTLKDANGNVLANKNITITILGKTYNVTTDKNGVAKVKVAATNSQIGKSLKVTYKFAGDSTYASTSGSSTIKVVKMATKITKVSTAVVKNHGYFYVKLTTKSGKVLAGKTITMISKVSGKKYKLKTNSKGIAKTDLWVKKSPLGKYYKYTFKYAGNAYYKPCTVTFSVKIVK